MVRQIKNAQKNNPDLKFEAIAFSVIFALPKKGTLLAVDLIAQQVEHPDLIGRVMGFDARMLFEKI